VIIPSWGEFDREHVAVTFRDMTPAEKTWRAAVGERRRGRLEPDKSVMIGELEIEPGLLKRADALAEKQCLRMS
jgi:hypothetical protein